MKIDNQLTERIEAWLAMPEHTDDADIMEGALKPSLHVLNAS